MMKDEEMKMIDNKKNNEIKIEMRVELYFTRI